MSFYYAQINSENICCGVSELATETNDHQLISIPELNLSILGKKWNGSDWENLPQSNN